MTTLQRKKLFAWIATASCAIYFLVVLHFMPTELYRKGGEWLIVPGLFLGAAAILGWEGYWLEDYFNGPDTKNEK